MVHQCNECDSSFREKKNLQQHMRKRHGLKKYKCSHCNDRFDNRSSVSKHEKQKHGNELFHCEHYIYIYIYPLLNILQCSGSTDGSHGGFFLFFISQIFIDCVLSLSVNNCSLLSKCSSNV